MLWKGVKAFGQDEITGVRKQDCYYGHWYTNNDVDKHSDTSRKHLPDAAAVNYLIGKLWLGYGDVTKAVDCFVESLKISPFLWESFSELCKTGMLSTFFDVFYLTPARRQHEGCQCLQTHNRNAGRF